MPLVHAAVGKDGGLGLHDGESLAEMHTALRGADADLVFARHTHAPMERMVDGVWAMWTLRGVGRTCGPPSGWVVLIHIEIEAQL